MSYNLKKNNLNITIKKRKDIKGGKNYDNIFFGIVVLIIIFSVYNTIKEEQRIRNLSDNDLERELKISRIQRNRNFNTHHIHHRGFGY